MANPSKIKGDRFEWDLINYAALVLTGTGLEIERTKAGSERDLGDLHVRTADRAVLAAVQAKNRRERKWAEWLEDTGRQAERARARFGALFVKRVGVADVGRSYAIMSVAEWLRLLAALHAAERDRAILSDRTYRKDLELDSLRAGVPEVACPNCSATIRARMADAPRPCNGTIRCDRCLPGVGGERIDVRLHGQQPCEHVGGP